jgi:hypothetical protein
VVTFTAKRACFHGGGIALEVPSGVLFHGTPHNVVILFGPYFYARAFPTRLHIIIIYISTISHRLSLLYTNSKLYLNLTILGFSVKGGRIKAKRKEHGA